MDQILSAAKPPKVTYELLRTWGFTSSNDRAIVTLLKQLGFLTEDGAPTEHYDGLRDRGEKGRVLAERMRALYADIFAVNQNACNLSDDKVQNIFRRVTGKEDVYTKRYANVFRALCQRADFTSGVPDVAPVEEQSFEEPVVLQPDHPALSSNEVAGTVASAFVYRIEIHLPATTDLKVYNAIFRSIRENLVR
jgi:hypothetical protein